MWLRTLLPEHYLLKESQDSIKVATGLIATMTALVLGLVTASTKSSFDAIDSAVTQAAMQSLTLDRVLARYGRETDDIRNRFQHVLRARVDAVWQQASKTDTGGPAASPALVGAEQLTEEIRRLTPTNDSQRALQTKAVDLAESLLQSRWITIASMKTSVPMPFLAVLVFWLAFIFMSFGLLSPRNGLVVAVLFVCALSVASAMFLILEMDSPFSGIIHVSADPLRNAISRLNQ
jgi:hypothetical protein